MPLKKILSNFFNIITQYLFFYVRKALKLMVFSFPKNMLTNVLQTLLISLLVWRFVSKEEGRAPHKVILWCECLKLFSLCSRCFSFAISFVLVSLLVSVTRWLFYLFKIWTFLQQLKLPNSITPKVVSIFCQLQNNLALNN